MNKKSRSSSLRVKSDGEWEMSADIDGITRLDRLVLVDQKDGKEWEFTINDGKIVIEPYDID